MFKAVVRCANDCIYTKNNYILLMLCKMLILLLFFGGPTCTGKSSFAINLSKEITGVIINSDAMQVYKQWCYASL